MVAPLLIIGVIIGLVFLVLPFVLAAVATFNLFNTVFSNIYFTGVILAFAIYFAGVKLKIFPKLTKKW